MNKTYIYWIGGACLVFIGFIILGHYNNASTTLVAKPISDPSTLPGMQNNAGPWQTEISHLKERLSLMGLPALTAEGTVMHIHQHLDIYIHSKPIGIPANIGINNQAGFISPIHVHDTTGVIHVESPTVETFTLGQFFDIWSVPFTQNCIGNYCNDSKNTLKIYSNGKLYSGDPRQLTLQAHEEITIVYGTDKEVPASLPTAFTFPQGE